MRISFIKKPFSYKLHINICPDWYKILQHQYPKLSEKELMKFINNSKKKSDENSLFQSSFDFVEFYDNVSGMLIHWFEKWVGGKNMYRGFCDDFEIEGNIFNFKNVIVLPSNKYDETKGLRMKISSSGITTMKKNKNYVMHPDNLFEENKVLSYIPLDELVEFFIELGNRFHDTEMNSIIKWPEKFQKIFKKYRIKYFHWDGNDYKPTLFDIEKYDKKFLEKWKGLKIALYGSNPSHRFETKYADYEIRIKLFRPEP